MYKPVPNSNLLEAGLCWMRADTALLSVLPQSSLTSPQVLYTVIGLFCFIFCDIYLVRHYSMTNENSCTFIGAQLCRLAVDTAVSTS